MRRAMQARSVAIAVALGLGLLPQISRAADLEDRCVELGADCACNETFDWDGSSGVGPGLINPPNSVSKQCNGSGKTLDLANTQRTVRASTVGLDGPTNVLSILSHEAGNMFDSNRDFTNGTYCTREYIHFDQGFPSPENTDQNIKGPRNNKPVGAPHPGFETGWRIKGGPLGFAPQGNHGTPFGSTARQAYLALTAGSDVRFQECKDAWCRIEYCFDHNHDGQQKLRFRGRITNVTTGKQAVYGPEMSVGSAPTAESGSNSFPAHFFSNNMESGHYAYHSHVLVSVRKPADPNFWIGEAYEIEDGTPTVPLPDPDPTPTPDPDPVPDPAPPPPSSETGLPFVDDFESGLDYTRWPHSGTKMSVSGARASSGSKSLAGQVLSGDNNSQWLLHYFGDANAVAPGSISCTAEDCPGGMVDDVYVKFDFYLDGVTANRKVMILGSFNSWDGTFGTNQQNSAYYFSLPLGLWSGGPDMELSFNSWRRHDNAGNQVGDIIDSALVTDVIRTGKWYELQVHAKLNTPGSSDGIMEIWLDGTRIVNRRDMNFRGGYDLTGWNYLMLTDNGEGPASGSLQLFWDDVVIDTRAPGGGATAPPLAPILLAD
jgi:hypothetical protein